MDEKIYGDPLEIWQQELEFQNIGDEKGMKKDMEIFQRYGSKMNGFSELLKIRERVGSERAEIRKGEQRSTKRGSEREPLQCVAWVSLYRAKLCNKIRTQLRGKIANKEKALTM